MHTFELNYERLVKLGIHSDQSNDDYRRSIAPCFMDLVVERLHHLDNEATTKPGEVYSLAHYFEQNGDLCCDPEMTVIVYPDEQMAEALTFQQAIPPLYQVVYPSPGSVIPRHRRELNYFLKAWLRNLINQGHGAQWTSAL